jgi:hypothetical protein
MPTGEHTGEYIETNSIFLEYQKQLFLPDWAVSFYGIWIGWILHREGKDMLGDFFVV